MPSFGDEQFLQHDMLINTVAGALWFLRLVNAKRPLGVGATLALTAGNSVHVHRIGHAMAGGAGKRGLASCRQC